MTPARIAVATALTHTRTSEPSSTPGALADVPDWLRYGAVAAGLAVFMLTRRSIFAGVVCGEVVLVAGKWWLG